MMPPAVDSLLAAVAVDVEAFAMCEIASDVCLVTPPIPAIEVHYVVAGPVYFATAGQPLSAFEAGTVMVVPPGLSQRLAGSSSPRHDVAAAAVCEQGPAGMTLFDARGSEGSDVRVLCGKVHADIGGSFGPLDGMAAPITATLDDTPFVRRAFEAMVTEIRHGAIGARAIVSALMKACLVALLRHHALHHATCEESVTLSDRPRLARTVAAVTTNPAGPHSVASLASVAGMSRSAFAKAFVGALGIPPMEYVGRSRLARARDLVVSTNLPIGMIATQVGFASRSHFSRLFRTRYKIDPSSYRRQSQAEQRSRAGRL